MANYAIDPKVLQPYVPAYTELDLFDNIYYASLVGFLFTNTRLRGISVPFHRTFEEVNLRFYVRYKENGQWKRGAYVLLPVFLPDGELDWAAFDGPDSLAPAGHGLLEPVGRRYGPDALARADAVVCPAVAVDRRGTRLGRGAGCYDRALARKGPHTPAIALVHDEEFVESLPAEPHDRPVDAVVTPSGGVRVLGAGVWPGGPAERERLSRKD